MMPHDQPELVDGEVRRIQGGGLVAAEVVLGGNQLVASGVDVRRMLVMAHGGTVLLGVRLMVLDDQLEPVDSGVYRLEGGELVAAEIVLGPVQIMPCFL